MNGEDRIKKDEKRSGLPRETGSHERPGTQGPISDAPIDGTVESIDVSTCEAGSGGVPDAKTGGGDLHDPTQPSRRAMRAALAIQKAIGKSMAEFPAFRMNRKLADISMNVTNPETAEERQIAKTPTVGSAGAGNWLNAVRSIERLAKNCRHWVLCWVGDVVYEQGMWGAAAPPLEAIAHRQGMRLKEFQDIANTATLEEAAVAYAYMDPLVVKHYGFPVTPKVKELAKELRPLIQQRRAQLDQIDLRRATRGEGPNLIPQFDPVIKKVLEDHKR